MGIRDRLHKLAKRRPLQEGLAHVKKARAGLPIRPLTGAKQRVKEVQKSIKDL